MNKKIEVKGVSYLYGKGTPFEKLALDNVDISFETGKITGLIGHTGSGKSTLVQMLNGILRPHEGRVLLNGEDIWEKKKTTVHTYRYEGKPGIFRKKFQKIIRKTNYSLYCPECGHAYEVVMEDEDNLKSGECRVK